MAYVDYNTYDVVVNQPGLFATMMGREQKTEDQLRDEQYVGCLLSVSKILRDWCRRALPHGEAVLHADHYMEKVRMIDVVNAERVCQLLEEHGLGVEQRQELENLYKELKRACGQKVPQYGKHTKSCC
mmetsp:Transcript_124803/g.249216  ORF Transcript_124803/g.249216 Transcript_124803/m.249216 type:complete len:128 (-) Transcript_124803:58-441(-)